MEAPLSARPYSACQTDKCCIGKGAYLLTEPRLHEMQWRAVKISLEIQKYKFKTCSGLVPKTTHLCLVTHLGLHCLVLLAGPSLAPCWSHYSLVCAHGYRRQRALTALTQRATVTDLGRPLTLMLGLHGHHSCLPV